MASSQGGVEISTPRPEVRTRGRLGELARRGALFKGIRTLATFIFLTMIVATFFLVIVREMLRSNYPWLDDLVRFLLVWSVYFGAAVACREHDHIAVEVLYTRFSPRVKGIVDRVIAIVGVAVSLLVVYFGWQMTERAIVGGQRSISGFLPAWAGYAAIPVAFAFCALGYLIVAIWPNEPEEVETVDLGLSTTLGTDASTDGTTDPGREE